MFQREISVWFVEPFLKPHFQAGPAATQASFRARNWFVQMVNSILEWNSRVLNYSYHNLPKPFAQVNGKQLKKLVKT